MLTSELEKGGKAALLVRRYGQELVDGLRWGVVLFRTVLQLQLVGPSPVPCAGRELAPSLHRLWSYCVDAAMAIPGLASPDLMSVKNT